ncbi:hypothetical protein AM10699_62720 (plasmid) [Acaryochloris marina MBIC10699]|nr:hypothetical protein AM10699_62720 [Acaryochloris marina MBIC10699]
MSTASSTLSAPNSTEQLQRLRYTCAHVMAMAGSDASCHVGYRSCFYRQIPVGTEAVDSSTPIALTFTEAAKTFDPKQVYGNAPNPTQL